VSIDRAAAEQAGDALVAAQRAADAAGRPAPRLPLLFRFPELLAREPAQRLGLLRTAQKQSRRDPWLLGFLALWIGVIVVGAFLAGSPNTEKILLRLIWGSFPIWFLLARWRVRCALRQVLARAPEGAGHTDASHAG
jgi:hypothetical protein